MATVVPNVLRWKAGDLPIEQPAKFELVVNAKTTKAPAITIPGEVLLQVTRVIE